MLIEYSWWQSTEPTRENQYPLQSQYSFQVYRQAWEISTQPSDPWLSCRHRRVLRQRVVFRFRLYKRLKISKGNLEKVGNWEKEETASNRGKKSKTSRKRGNWGKVGNKEPSLIRGFKNLKIGENWEIWKASGKKGEINKKETNEKTASIRGKISRTSGKGVVKLHEFEGKSGKKIFPFFLHAPQARHYKSRSVARLDWPSLFELYLNSSFCSEYQWKRQQCQNEDCLLSIEQSIWVHMFHLNFLIIFLVKNCFLQIFITVCL